jgi:hypothetical protein
MKTWTLVLLFVGPTLACGGTIVQQADEGAHRRSCIAECERECLVDTYWNLTPELEELCKRDCPRHCDDVVIPMEKKMDGPEW